MWATEDPETLSSLRAERVFIENWNPGFYRKLRLEYEDYLINREGKRAAIGPMVNREFVAAALASVEEVMRKVSAIAENEMARRADYNYTFKDLERRAIGTEFQ